MKKLIEINSNLMYRILFFLLWAAFLMPEAAASKSWHIERVSITAEILSDGTVSYTERRTYRFNGSFSQANYELSKSGFDSISDIRVFDNGRELELASGNSPGRFRIEDKRNSVNIRWYYSARDETRTFEIRYVLHGAVVTGPEYAEFFWTFLTSRWEKQTEQLEVELILPESDRYIELEFWVRGASDRVRVNRTTRGFLLHSTEALSRNNTIAVRSVFSSHIFDTVPVTDPGFSLEVARNEEVERVEMLAQRAIQAEKMWEIGMYLGFVTILLSLYLFFTMFNKYGRKHKVQIKLPEILFSPPSDHKPAYIGWFLNHRQGSPAFITATLFDLGRRGFFHIREGEPEKKRFSGVKQVIYIEPIFPAPDEKLTDAENHLYQMLIDQVKVQKTTRLDELFGSRNKKLSKWYFEFLSKVNKEALAMGWMDPVSKAKSTRAIVYQILITITAVALAILTKAPLIVAGSILAFLMIFFSMSIYRRTPEGEVLFQMWNAYKKGLHVASRENVKSIKPDVHLIYAIALGISGKKLDGILQKLNFDDDPMLWMTFMFNPAMGTSAIANSVSSISTAITTSTTVATGSGASAGSAGGGAGGGAS